MPKQSKRITAGCETRTDEERRDDAVAALTTPSLRCLIEMSEALDQECSSLPSAEWRIAVMALRELSTSIAALNICLPRHALYAHLGKLSVLLADAVWMSMRGRDKDASILLRRALKQAREASVLAKEV